MRPLFAYLKENSNFGFTAPRKTGFTGKVRFYAVLRRFYAVLRRFYGGHTRLSIRFYGFTPSYRGKP